MILIEVLDQPATQKAFGDVVGISQPAASDLIKRGVLRPGGTFGEWIRAYCAHQREIAAGRVAVGDINLVTERARLASEQADRVAMLNAERRRELVPLGWVAAVIARHCRQIAGIFDGIVPSLRRIDINLTAADLEHLEREITKARNLAGEFDLTTADLDEPDRDPYSIEGGLPDTEEVEPQEAQPVG